jgi:hypothetical protein
MNSPEIQAYNGRRITLRQAAALAGLTLAGIKGRLLRGMTLAEAIETPRAKRGRKPKARQAA